MEHGVVSYFHWLLALASGAIKSGRRGELQPQGIEPGRQQNRTGATARVTAGKERMLERSGAGAHLTRNVTGCWRLGSICGKSDARYCSIRCRVAAYRAKAMHF